MHEEISHCLRTPLTSVLGFTSTLIDQWDTLDDTQRLEFIQIVYGEALRMSHSVEFIDRRLYFQLAERAVRSPYLKPHICVADAS